MPSSDISELYYLNRYPQHLIGLLKFLLYLPFGIILMILRILLGLQVFILGFILPDVPLMQRLLSKLLCLALGITIHVESADKKQNVQVYISNCVTPFDHLVIHSVADCITPGQDIFNSLITSAYGLKSYPSSSNLNELKKYISLSITNDKISLHFQPENKQTTGKSVLKFKTWYFNICDQVQPISIQVERPFLDLKISSFNSTYWIDTIGYLFSPYTSYKVTFLTVVEKNTLSEEDFAEKVRQDIATALKVDVSEYSAADLLEWEKRVIEDIARREREGMLRPTYNSTSRSMSEIHMMARQVKEVLPMVPFNIICTDLAKTRNVDQTITNLLEGRIFYIPETSVVSNLSSHSTNTLPTTSKRKNIIKQVTSSNSSPIFAKSSQERMMSFQERKQQLIENARQRYIEKHGLNIIGSS